LRFFLVNQVNVSFHVKYSTGSLAAFIFVAETSGAKLIVDSREQRATYMNEIIY
jgi:hypothetical protein